MISQQRIAVYDNTVAFSQALLVEDVKLKEPDTFFKDGPCEIGRRQGGVAG